MSVHEDAPDVPGNDCTLHTLGLLMLHTSHDCCWIHLSALTKLEFPKLNPGNWSMVDGHSKFRLPSLESFWNSQGICTQNLLVVRRAQAKSCPSEQRGPPEQLIQSAVALNQLSNCPPSWVFQVLVSRESSQSVAFWFEFHRRRDVNVFT